MSRQPPRRRQTAPKPTSYAGSTTWLRCDEVFDSWDRRQNRLCPRCQQAIETHPPGEPPYSPPSPGASPECRMIGDDHWQLAAFLPDGLWGLW
jgi:hypothetical protein